MQDLDINIPLYTYNATLKQKYVPCLHAAPAFCVVIIIRLQSEGDHEKQRTYAGYGSDKQNGKR